MIIYLIGIVILELVLLGIFKKLRKYTIVMMIVDATTFIMYSFFKDLYFSLALALLIDTVFVAYIQNLSERKIIYQYEKKYQSNTYDYYRDILEEKSPGILSLCYNSRKMNFKDIVVSILLYLKQIQMIEFVNDDIKVIGDISKIKNHERIVLEYIENKSNKKKIKKKFYSALIEDTENENYIFMEKENKVNMTLFAQIIIVIMILLFIIYLFIGPFVVPLFFELTNLKKINFTGLSFLGYFLCFVSIPIYQWIENRINLIVRTNKGFELCGKLSGLKNFLKDFSKLSDSELKQMKLYDEYVIYSVVFNLKGKLDKESKKLYNTLVAFPKLKVKNKIIKNNYTVESISKIFTLGVASFSFIWFLFMIFMIMKGAYTAFLALLVVFIIIVIIGMIEIIRKLYFIKRRNTILNYGMKFPGIIVGRECIHDDGPDSYYVIVRYQKEGREYECNSPFLSFSPFDLKNNDVDVYHLKGYCYIDNFKRK